MGHIAARSLAAGEPVQTIISCNCVKAVLSCCHIVVRSHLLDVLRGLMQLLRSCLFLQCKYAVKNAVGLSVDCVDGSVAIMHRLSTRKACDLMLTGFSGDSSLCREHPHVAMLTHSGY